MGSGLKVNQLAAIDLERHVVKERPAGERFLRVVKRSALRKARSVPSFDARRNSRRAGSQTKADRHPLATPTRHVAVERRRKRWVGESDKETLRGGKVYNTVNFPTNSLFDLLF